MASIRTAGLAKNFGDLRAVNEIDLDLPEGGVAGFVGPNGAGKSTTIRMLLGLITPPRRPLRRGSGRGPRGPGVRR
jgi:ABC-2 type transport system ATP-binding protein